MFPLVIDGGKIDNVKCAVETAACEVVTGGGGTSKSIPPSLVYSSALPADARQPNVSNAAVRLEGVVAQ